MNQLVARYIYTHLYAYCINGWSRLSTGETAHARAALVMPVYPATLQQLPRPYKQDRVLRIGRELIQALAHVHANGLVHCDIKASNIFVDYDGKRAITMLWI
jgi:serine/threonine protein kinase